MSEPSLPASSEPPPLIFATTVEGLFENALRGRVTPRLRQRLAALGLHLDRPLLPAYPSAQWHQVLEAVVQEVWPELSRPEAYRQLGRQVVLGFVDTLVGKAIAVLARVLGVRRMLERLERNVRSGDNHTRIRFTPIGERQARMEVSHVTDFPSYDQGIIEAATELAGGRQAQVELLAHQPPGATYVVRWH